jgi:hypothetical protein
MSALQLREIKDDHLTRCSRPQIFSVLSVLARFCGCCRIKQSQGSMYDFESRVLRSPARKDEEVRCYFGIYG